MTASPGDSSLVAQARAGERSALGALIERHRPLALRLAARLLADAAEAEDVVQEACLQAALGLDRLREPERFAAWLCGIALNLARMRLRARRDVAALEDWEGGRLARGFHALQAQVSVEAACEVRELHAAVLRALAALPAEQQAVVRLHYLDGLTLEEIGVLAGAPTGTLKARLHRARRRLRAELSHELFEAGMVRKERSRMVEVIIEQVLIRTAVPKDVVESSSREMPGPEAAPARVPLPPGVPPGAQVVMMHGDEQGAQRLFQVRAPVINRVVLLKEKSGPRVLPIWIGPHEADMLALQLAGTDTPRPLTYDLVARLLEIARARLTRMTVSQLKDEVFYATLRVEVGGVTHEVDARPSDALNLALRSGVPIFVDEQVLAAAGIAQDQVTQKLDEMDQKSGSTEAALPDYAQYVWSPLAAPEIKLPRRPPDVPAK